MAYLPQAPTAASALAKIREGIEELAAWDPDACSDAQLAEALVAADDAQTRLAAQDSRLIRSFDRRQAYRHDACLTTAAWLRFKTNLGHRAARRQVARAMLLERMDHLRRAYEAGAVATEHVDAILQRATPSRASSIAEHDATLTRLARDAEPRDVAVAVQRIVDHVDRDGADDPAACSDEDLRELTVRRGYAGLGHVCGSTTAALTELLLRVHDVYDTDDPAGTPAERRRTQPQRFHDALRDALTVALDNHPGSAVTAVKTHVVIFADLFTLLVDDELARIRPRLSETGVVDPETARHLIATTNPTMRAVLGLGPWMPVTVGRTRRTLPDWLRAASELIHQRCRGPGCGLRFSVTEADHALEWTKGGVTALSNDTPLCRGHHALKHEDGWGIRFDTATGVVTWTSRAGARVIDLFPPDP